MSGDLSGNAIFWLIVAIIVFQKARASEEV